MEAQRLGRWKALLLAVVVVALCCEHLLVSALPLGMIPAHAPVSHGRRLLINSCPGGDNACYTQPVKEFNYKPQLFCCLWFAACPTIPPKDPTDAGCALIWYSKISEGEAGAGAHIDPNTVGDGVGSDPGTLNPPNHPGVYGGGGGGGGSGGGSSDPAPQDPPKQEEANASTCGGSPCYSSDGSVGYCCPSGTQCSATSGISSPNQGKCENIGGGNPRAIGGSCSC